MSPKEKVERFLDEASRSKLMVYACVFGLIGLALMYFAPYGIWGAIDRGMAKLKGVGGR